MANANERELTIRRPFVQDGADMWRLTGETKALDINSVYAYLMMCDMFADTCAVAFLNDRLAGIVTGYRKPAAPDTLFIWQIGVHPDYQGEGIGKRLIRNLLEREALSDIRYVEATVGTGNEPSRQLFVRLAAQFGAECRIAEHYGKALFPREKDHAPEHLIRVGPLPALASASAKQFEGEAVN